jgi:hypothetical protein
MKTVRHVMLPVKMLWEYREFKRDEVPAPRIPYIHDYNTDQITQYVSLHGMAPVELSIVKDRALLTDGNHRIVAARNLGYNHIPVKVVILFGDGSDTFYEQTLQRFKPIEKELEFELKKMFLGNDFLKDAQRHR